MKKFVLAALAASIVATPAMAAPQQRWDNGSRYGQAYRHDNYRGYQANQYRQWNRGDRFDYRQARNYRQINDWRAYRGRHLYAPPRGYRWVQSGNDAVLVAIAGGLIGAVLTGAFN